MGEIQPPVTRRPGAIGQYDLNLDIEERTIIVNLLGDLQRLLDNPDQDPDGRLRRLFPSAYHQARDSDDDAEFRRLMRDDLVTSRLLAIERIAGALTASAPATDDDGRGSPDHADSGRGRRGRTAGIVLDTAQVEALVQSVNGIRLVLGTMLDVSEDDPDDIADDDPLIGERYLYDYLSWVLDSAIVALQGAH